MKAPIAVRKFPKYSVENLMYKLTRAGKFTVDSEFAGTGYLLEKDTLIIISGKNGMLSINYEQIDHFAEELKAVKELAVERKRMRLIGD